MKRTVLIVDDDDLIAIQLEAILGQDFDVLHACSGKEGIDQAGVARPDLILLDIQLPDLDGYSVCRQLKADEALADIPVIFVSANIRVEDRLAAYEVGGAAYVTKPFIPDELRHRVTAIDGLTQRSRELEETVREVSQTAMAALAAVGDAGRILEFLREIVTFTGFGEIADASFRILSEFNLEGSIQLRSRNGKFSRSNSGMCSPLEESVLTTMADCDRIVDLGPRSAFNYEHVSIIINNMPRQHPEQYGRIKDNVTIIANAIDLHMCSLDLLLESINRGDTLLGLLRKNAKSMQDIEVHHREQREQSAAILNKLVKDIEDSFIHMGLTDRQELKLQNLARDAVAKAQALYEQSIEMESLMESRAIMESLGEGLADSLQQELSGAADSSVNQIELF
ncbi:response regulator [Burkholderiaceae bacterium DAT-1]|nr:response regulator [Burkholderiaceae bacterium DAT-1]